MQNKKKDELDKIKKGVNAYAKYSTISFQMGAIIFCGVFGGFKIDEYFAFKKPYFTVLLSVLSVFLAVYYVIKDLLKK